jgi:cytochrome c oxidase accessory protein FixG
MCPWPRFQSAMFDEHSLVVTYEAWRGEPRANAKVGTSPEGRGHCIDCGLCVRVCPTGIDIRNGQQLDCIGCGLCVDACNSVMAKMGWPRELITYDSLANMGARARKERPRYRFVRGRTIIYAALLVVIAAVMAVSLATRSTAGLNVLQVRAPLFVRLTDGSIRNGYTLKITNKRRGEKTFKLTLSGLDGAELSVIGSERAADGSVALTVPGDSVGTFNAFVRVPMPAATGRREGEEESTRFGFQITDTSTGEVASHEAVFSAPEH